MNDEYIEKLANDFAFFVKQLWLELGLQKHHPIGYVEEDICHWVQYGPDRQGVLANRSFGKTHLVTASVTLWDLFRNPESKILIVSKSGGSAKETLSLIRGWITQVSFLRHLRPSNHKRSRAEKAPRDGAWAFDVGPSQYSRTPSVSAVGIDGQLPSRRASRVIADDIETQQNTVTCEARDALNDIVREFSNICSYKPRKINYVGTYWHEESVYIKLNDRGYTFRTWPLLTPHTDDKIIGLAPVIQEKIDNGELNPASARGVFDGDIIAPYRFDEDWIINQKSEGRTNFAMQHMLISDLGNSLRYPLQLKDLIVLTPQNDKAPSSIAWGVKNGQGDSTAIQDIPSMGFGRDRLYSPIWFDPQWAPYSSVKMWVDPSGRGADKTAYAIVGECNGYLYALDMDGLEGGFAPSVLERLAQKAREYRVHEVHVEDFALQEAVGQLLEPVLKSYWIDDVDSNAEYAASNGAKIQPTTTPYWRCGVHMTRPSSIQKELRILGALEPVIQNHRLIVARHIAENSDFQKQLTRITRQRNALPHEDELEALALCVNLFDTALRIDPHQASERFKERQIDDALKNFRNKQRSIKPQGQQPRPTRQFNHNAKQWRY